jgi:hypothetical protein
MVKAALAFMVTLLATAEAVLTFGLKVVPVGIVTLVLEVGTVAHDQLEAVFQSTLVPPNHVPGDDTVIVASAVEAVHGELLIVHRTT